MEEDGEDDHKVLVTIPGQDVPANQELLVVLRDFIYGVFAKYPETTVRVGRIQPRQIAQRYVQEHRDA